MTDLNLSEFLGYGLQKAGKVSKPLMRKNKDGKIIRWDVNSDDTLCTLQEAFDKVDPKLGFNVELKFDDHIVYQEDQLINVLHSVLQVYMLDCVKLRNLGVIPLINIYSICF